MTRLRVTPSGDLSLTPFLAIVIMIQLFGGSLANRTSLGN